jgi:tRNA A37 methylthiotransferase MiaB
LESHEKQKSVCVVTNGCTEGRIDSALLECFFKESPDFRLCRDCMKADLIVFVGCCATQDKEFLSRLIIESLHSKKRQDAQVLVTGCIAKVRPELAYNGEELKPVADRINRLLQFEDKWDSPVHFPHGEFWQISRDLLGPGISKAMVSDYYNQALTGILPRTSLTVNAAIIRLFAKYRRLIDKEMLLPGNQTFFIKICTGCAGNCSYCSIRLARGKIKSKPIDAVLKEFKQGLDEGFKDFALIGTDIGDYGKDMGADLIDLLEKLVACEGKFTLRLRNVNPRWLIPSVSRFCQILKTGKIKYLLCPVESGSNRILERMNRGYHIEEYLQAIRQVRNAYPPIFLKTQIIVGFPGETKADFRKSRQLFKLGLFDYVDVLTYSKRPKTKASLLPDEVPHKIIARRYREILFRTFFQLPLKRWLSICMLNRR